MTDTKPAMITGLIDEWQLRTAEAKQRLRLQYVPFHPTPFKNYQSKLRRFLSSRPD